MSDYDARVERGIKLLDRKVPDWRESVDRERLHLGDNCGCVLGQLFGDYELGARNLGLNPYKDEDRLHDLGFFDLNDSYSWLTRAWRKVLRRV